MDLIDEQDDVATCANLLQDLLEALFKVAAVPATGDEGTEIKRIQMLVGEGVWNLSGHNALREALDYGRLADPRLSYEHRIVLRAPRQHLHDALYLAHPANDRIKLAISCELSEVAAELIENGGAAGRPFARTASSAATRMTRGALFALYA